MGVYPDVGALEAISPYPLVSRPSISPLGPSEILFSTVELKIPGKTPIPGSNLLLSRELVLRVETTRDGIVLRSEFVDEESFGATLEEAYDDFLTSLRDRLRSLERRSGLLSTGDRTILERLQGILESSQR